MHGLKKWSKRKSINNRYSKPHNRIRRPKIYFRQYKISELNALKPQPISTDGNISLKHCTMIIIVVIQPLVILNAAVTLIN